MIKSGLVLRVWWLMLPLAAITIIFILPVLSTYTSFVLRHPEPYTDTPMNSRVILLGRIRTLTEIARNLTFERLNALDESGFDTFKLKVSSEGLGRLNSRLPDSKKQWVKAKAQFPREEDEHAVKVRYIGDNLHHWGFPAKSWRVLLPKDGSIEGNRTFNFIVPRWRAATSYYLPLKAANLLNILSPEARFVNLEVNGHRHGGVHLLTEKIDEGFLRHRGRLPGDIYIGDMVLDDGLPREQAHSLTLWQLPGAWRKAAENNKFDASSIEPIQNLLTLLARDFDTSSHERLISSLDLNAWARFAAWQKLMGATHIDEGHNWILYYDYAKETIEPILRDGNALTDDLMQVTGAVPGLETSLTNPLLTALHQDHRFLRLKHLAIADFFADQKDKALLKDFDEIVPKVASALKSSQQMDWLEMPEGKPLRYFTSDEFRKRALSYRAMLESWFNMQRSLITFKPENIRLRHKAQDRLLIQINGYAPVDELALPITRVKEPLSVCLRTAANSPCELLTSLHSVNNDTLRIKLPLFAALKTKPQGSTHSGAHLIAEPAIYEVMIRGATFDPSRRVFANGYRTEPFTVRENGEFNLSEEKQLIYGLIPVQHQSTWWRGEIRVTETTSIAGDLFVAPGTRVLLAPGVSLFIHGKLIANGAPGAPILFTRQDTSKPWGTIAIIGPNSDGTRIRFSSFVGGSGFKDRKREFSGMMEIRNAKNVLIESSTFSDNTVCDDILHITYSQVVLRDITLKNANSDAIDIDISTVYIDGLNISNSKNDGLDLMTSDVYARNAQISGSGDKGISVGEASFLLLEDSSLTNNVIGLEGKDGSQVYAVDSVLKKNQISISGYKKNKHYPGNVKIVLERTNVDLVESQLRLLNNTDLIQVPARRQQDIGYLSNLKKRAEDFRRNLKESGS